MLCVGVRQHASEGPPVEDDECEVVVDSDDEVQSTGMKGRPKGRTNKSTAFKNRHSANQKLSAAV